jgi:hypothetical protein
MPQPATRAPAGVTSPLVAALEHAWATIRRQHPDVPDVVLVVASGGDAKRLHLGHFAPDRWQVNGAGRHEVLVGAEGLRRGPTDVLATLLHEAAHGLARARGIKDTSRQGRYHNRRYATLAAELGLDVAHDQRIGWSRTTVPDATAAAYQAVLEELAAALILWRYLDQLAGPKSPSRNLLACTCPCGRKLRAAKATLADAPILCGACHGPFEPDDTDQDD